MVPEASKCRSARAAWRSASRRCALALVLAGVFAVSFGGSFTCEVNQNDKTDSRPDPPPR